jgi:hypothetical protein
MALDLCCSLTSHDAQLLRYMIYDPLTSQEAATTNGVMLNGHTDFNSIRFDVFPKFLCFFDCLPSSARSCPNQFQPCRFSCPTTSGDM